MTSNAVSCKGSSCVALLVLACAAACQPSAAWSHGWDTAGSAYWGDFGYSLLTPTQATFVAHNYRVASLEKCTGRAQGMPTEAAIYQTAAQLKAINPAIKVMFYWSTSQAGISCYSNNATFMAHPEWWLRDDHGNVVGAGGDQSGPRIDPRNEAAATWWISVPLAGKGAVQLIDGILADDAGYNVFPNMSVSRLQAHYTAKLAMLARMQAAFTAANGGVVMGNGFSEYDQSPTDPHNLRILSTVDAVQNEHYAAFEQVDGKTGALLKDKAANVLDNIEAASRNASKQIFCSFWAGPYTGFKAGWPAYYDDSQPSGTQAQIYTGWQKELTKYLTFNLASFLLVAAENTWFTQAVWYELHQGFVNCPEAPSTCAAPPGWYPELGKPLGAPLGPRKQLAQYKWRRDFANATVIVDLNDPLASSIAFHDGADATLATDMY